MKHTLLLIFLLFCSNLLSAQQFPTKDQWEHPLFGRVPRVNMPVQNNAALQEEELNLRQMGRAPQFAKAIEVDYNPENSGIWVETNPGTSRWRLSVCSACEHSQNIGVTNFYLPGGA